MLDVKKYLIFWNSAPTWSTVLTKRNTDVGYLPESLSLYPPGAFRKKGTVNLAQCEVWMKFAVIQLRTPVTVSNHKASKIKAKSNYRHLSSPICLMAQCLLLKHGLCNLTFSLPSCEGTQRDSYSDPVQHLRSGSSVNDSQIWQSFYSNIYRVSSKLLDFMLQLTLSSRLKQMPFR